ncbi:MAG: hypothetical protein WCK28_18355 [Burkholderiales bacterium]
MLGEHRLRRTARRETVDAGHRPASAAQRGGGRGAGETRTDDERPTVAARRAKWQPRKTLYTSGALWKYAQLVGPAVDGAVTHPGAAGESHVYADQ